MSTSGNPIVFLDVRIGTEKCGRIVLELFADVAPRTAENFRALCTGEKGAGASGRQLHYKGSVFHKAVLQFIIQGGDITHFDGSGGESIYGATFPDECFTVKHDRPGVLSMANAGPHTNSSQFFITTGAYPHLDNVNVAFGEVRAGLGVVLEVSAQPTEKDRPVLDCVVEDCGQLAPGQDWGVAESDGTADVYPPFPEDWHQDASRPPKVEAVERVVLDIKASGNSYFTAENYVDASRKYKKALRYIDWWVPQARGLGGAPAGEDQAGLSAEPGGHQAEGAAAGRGLRQGPVPARPGADRPQRLRGGAERPARGAGAPAQQQGHCGGDRLRQEAHQQLLGARESSLRENVQVRKLVASTLLIDIYFVVTGNLHL
ncbi:peptidyl-prolyl cis-trans isomerase D-like isoform X2 [Bacillus rossius redtenbacheri]|uniref:peptidyl-prolyl cis-trans isomerase D-like isoform X2 n=1 Tax=Bacillus rossius redtenbacheri TaxID=93214 RepID=UPI002FDCF2FA